MKFDIFMAVVFGALAVRTYKPRPRLRALRRADDEHDKYERERALARATTYRAPPPDEPQAFTDEDMAALTRKMSAEDAETLNLFHALNQKTEDEPEPEEITDLRNSVIYRGWRPQSDTTAPTLTGTIVQEVPDVRDAPAPEEIQDAWGSQGPSASYAEWKAEGQQDEWRQPVNLNWEEPDLLRDGVEVTLQKLALQCFGPAALEQGSA